MAGASRLFECCYGVPLSAAGNRVRKEKNGDDRRTLRILSAVKITVAEAAYEGP